jgi:hypothetical protein
MSLETHIAGSDDRLIDGLHFAGRNTASYITQRSSVTFAPQTSANLRTSGSRLLRFSLADQQGWLDGGTVRLVFKLTNLHVSGSLQPITDSPASMFRRMRVIANGSAVIEDIEEYGRCHQMFSELLPAQRRFNNTAESWGGANLASGLDSPVHVDPIEADCERTVCVHLMSSFLGQGKMIPLSMVPVILELELGEMNDCFAGGDASWEITRPRLIADVLQIDTSLQNSYAAHILAGKNLGVFMTGLYSVKSAVPTGSSIYSFPIARGFTRLSAVYISFWDGVDKYVNNFFSPLKGKDNTADNDDFEFYLNVGSDRYPQFSVDSHQECFYRLRLARQMAQGTDALSISPHAYVRNKFITALNLEKAPGASSHSGINTRSGSQLTLNLRNTGAATTCHVILVYDQVCNISAAGVEVLD